MRPHRQSSGSRARANRFKTKYMKRMSMKSQETNRIAVAAVSFTGRRWRICCGALVVVTLTFHIINSGGQQPTPLRSVPAAAASAGYAAGELLVKVGRPGASLQMASSPHDTVGATVLRSFPAIGWDHVRLPEGMTVGQGIKAYLALTGVLAAEPNYALELAAVPNDPLFSSQWGLRQISATRAWDLTTGSSNVVVAVIDEGADYNHPDLAANMWRNPGETGLDVNGQDKATN